MKTPVEVADLLRELAEQYDEAYLEDQLPDTGRLVRLADELDPLDVWPNERTSSAT